MKNQVNTKLLSNIANKLGATSAWHFGSSSTDGVDISPNDIDIAFIFPDGIITEKEIKIIKSHIRDCKVEPDYLYTKSKYDDSEYNYHIVLVSDSNTSLFKSFKASINKGYCFWGEQKSVH